MFQEIDPILCIKRSYLRHICKVFSEILQCFDQIKIYFDKLEINCRSAEIGIES